MDPCVWRQAAVPRCDRVPPTASAGPRPQRRNASGRLRVLMASLLMLALGVWLMITAFLWTRGAVGGFDAAWNDFVVGTAITVLAALRLFVPARFDVLPVVAVLLGLWQIAAPFVLDFTAAAGASAATWNSFIAGALVAVLATSPVPASRLGMPVR
jgi:hypothetical protein